MKKQSSGAGSKNSALMRIAVKDIKVSELNPRFGAQLETDALEKSLKKHGLLQPITLRPAQGGGYEVVIGSRRFRALSEERGADGYLEADEFTLVDWPDDIVIRASVAENEQRERLTVVDAGRFLNRLAARDSSLTDEKLASLTGLANRARINDMRALAERLHFLPEEWQKQLQVPENYRPGDKAMITITHFKHARVHIADDGSIPPKVRDLMVSAATKHWSASQLKDELEGLKADPNRALRNKPADEKEPKAPAHKRVITLLTAARKACGTDADTAELIRLLIGHVEEIMASANTKSADAPTASAGPATDATTPATDEKAA